MYPDMAALSHIDNSINGIEKISSNLVPESTIPIWKANCDEPEKLARKVRPVYSRFEHIQSHVLRPHLQTRSTLPWLVAKIFELVWPIQQNSWGLFSWLNPHTHRCTNSGKELRKIRQTLNSTAKRVSQFPLLKTRGLSQRYMIHMQGRMFECDQHDFRAPKMTSASLNWHQICNVPLGVCTEDIEIICRNVMMC